MSSSNVSICLWRALQSELGVEVATNDPELFKQRAYKIRAQEPDLRCLALRSCPTDPEGKVWITHQGEKEPALPSQNLEGATDGPSR
jgi:hypothetical protein